MDVQSLFNTRFNLPVVPVAVDPLSLETALLSPVPVPLVPTPALPAAQATADTVQLTLPTVQAAATAATTPSTEPVLAVDPTAARVESAAAVDTVGPGQLTQGQELDLEGEAVLQAQATELAAMRSGAQNPAEILSGLPPGSTGTLMGGGWIRAFPGQNTETSATAPSFFLGRVVAEVSPAASIAPTSGDAQNTSGGNAALEAYGHRRGSHSPLEIVVGQDFKAIPPEVDLLD